MLRKCKVLASRLRNDTLKKWVDAELNGYEDDESLPTYRVFQTVMTMTVHNPMQGTMTIPVPKSAVIDVLGEDVAEWISQARISQGIAEIAAISAGKGTPGFPWPPEMTMLVGQKITKWHPVKAQTVASTERLKGILDTVRNRVLDMALDLEEEDPTLGEGSPTDMPKPKAKRIDQIVQNHFHVTGDNATINAPVTQTQNNAKSGSSDNLKASLRQLGVAPEQTALVPQEEKTPKGVFGRVAALKQRLALKAVAAVEAVERFFKL